MSLSLNRQMFSFYQKGLKIIQENEHAICFEWGKIVQHFQETGRKSVGNVEATIAFFSDYLFSKVLDFDEKKEEHEKITYLHLQRQTIPIQTNKFIITLLENAVHKVLQEKDELDYKSHQAVHYFFSKLSETITSHPYQHYFSFDYFLRNLVASRQLPIHWAAIVLKKNDYYIVEKWFNHSDQDLLLANDHLKADTIYALSELLLEQMVEQEKKLYTVLPIPYQDVTFLICVTHEDSSRIIPFLTYALQIFENGRNMIIQTKDEHQWKDWVIMFNETILHSANYHEAIENITAGFVNYLPFERCALFSYSLDKEMGFEIYGHRIDNEALLTISQDLNKLPTIQNNLNILRLFKKNINYIQPLYIKDARYGFPEQYIEQFQLRSLVVAPIYTSTNNRLLGAALLDQGPGKSFAVTDETFSALLKCGKSAGEILATYLKKKETKKKKNAYHLSPREIEVLKLMAEGASTSEAAYELSLSEYTVRDYVSTIMQKMEARNRTEAVARAIRVGLI